MRDAGWGLWDNPPRPSAPSPASRGGIKIEPMRPPLKPLWFLLALVFLVEAWLWDHLRAAIAWLVNLVPLDKLKTRLAILVEKLPPWAVLIVFVVPFIV